MITYKEEIINNTKFYYANSEEFYIRKKGTEEIYWDAYDLIPTEYEETDLKKE